VVYSAKEDCIYDKRCKPALNRIDAFLKI